jgi:ABC-type glycerol-3-phosphate transport system permease component
VKASTTRKIAIYGAATVLGLFALFPLYWMVLTSLKGEDELYTSTPDFFPNGWHGDRYWDVLVDRGIGKALLHSLYVATLSTIVAVAFATLAGYALARMYVPLKAVILLVLMAVQMLPVVVTLIPLFIQLRNWNLLDSLPGLALVYVAFNVPLAVWLMREYLRGIPVEIEEAAMIDGCSRMQAMARVILPLALPGLAIAALLGFIASWSEFLFALTFITDGSKTTLPVAMVQTFTSRGGPDDTGMMVASVLYTVPVVIVFLILRRHLARGLVAGAVKG